MSSNATPPNLMHLIPRIHINKISPLEQPSSSTIEHINRASTDKHEHIVAGSQGYIRHNGDKAKYRAILKTHFLNNNFQTSEIKRVRETNGEEQYEAYVICLKNLIRKRYQTSNIIVMLKTQYPIIHNLVHKYFNFKFYNKQDHFNRVFLLWMDSYVSEEFVKRIKSYQRINHFPNSCQLGRKDLLSFNMKQAKRLMKDQYSFYPQSWILPKQYDLFSEQRQKEKFFIVKPHANCQGRGVYLTKNPTFTSKDQVIVQEYIDNPMLIHGYKFDLRIYVLLRSLDPLRIYVYKQGLCRLATSQYTKPNDSNYRTDKMHLTNYAINKLDPNFIGNRDINKDGQGHKRSYTSVIKHLSTNGFDTQKIEQRIDSIIVRTILAAYTKMLRSYRKTRENNTHYSPLKEGILKDESHASSNKQQPSVCFELLGFDIMLLQTGQPILLEINHQPSLIGDSPFDFAVKKSLVMDTVNMLNLDEKSKEQWEKCQKQGIPYKEKNQDQRQLEQMGGFKRIFPLTHIKIHDKSKEFKQTLQGTQLFYETIMNKFIFKDYSQLSKFKLGNYRTISSRVNCRQTQKINRKQSQVQSQRRSDSPMKVTKTGSSSQNPKAIALTFYNLFNDAKYHIKKGAIKKTVDKQEESQIDQNIIRNQIYLSQIDKKVKNKNPKPSKKFSKNPYTTANSSREKVTSKKEAEIEKLQKMFKQTGIERESCNLNTGINPSLMSENRMRENITSMRNRGLMSYLTSKKQKRTNSKKQGVNLTQGLDLSYEPFDSPNKDQNSEFKKTQFKKIIINQESSQSNNSCAAKYQQYKNIYLNPINQKVQKIANLKINKGQYQKLTFASFLQKSKQCKSRSNIQREASNCSQKQTSPSFQ